MNKTNFEHAAIAGAIQLALTPLLWLMAGELSFPIIFAGAMPGCFLFFGREHAQHERLLKKLPDMTDSGAAIGALNCFLWDWDSQLDFYFPVAGAIAQGAAWLIVMLLAA
ncbi:MAG: hypothetical protein LBR94_08845 [Desulfovibrio sp.]|jgi:hypothetical protein|nr:hypothetical protein [Desulfovibrio sp.]